MAECIQMPFRVVSGVGRGMGVLYGGLAVVNVEWDGADRESAVWCFMFLRIIRP